jgi:hypothetical protein
MAQEPLLPAQEINHVAVLNASRRTMPPANAGCQPNSRQMHTKMGICRQIACWLREQLLQDLISKSLTIIAGEGLMSSPSRYIAANADIALQHDKIHQGVIKTPSRDWTTGLKLMVKVKLPDLFQ